MDCINNYHESVISMSYSREDEIVAASYQDFTINFFQVQKNKFIQNQNVFIKLKQEMYIDHESLCTFIVQTADKQFVFADQSGTINYLSYPSLQINHKIQAFTNKISKIY